MESSNSSSGQKILIVSDAWNQINGVVTTLQNLVKELKDRGYEVRLFSHETCVKKFSMPFYSEITLGIPKADQIDRNIRWADAVHIATPEGTVGFKFLRYCVKNKIPFTTGYHTKWPEFISARIPFPQFITYSYMRWLHKHSKAILVPTESAATDLRIKGFKNLQVWTRGVDRTLFNEKHRSKKINHKRPLMVCVSRVSKEKGLDDFCGLEWGEPHTKMLVGDGPYLESLKQKYPSVVFTGALRGETLAKAYADADVFVFPSRTDTFGVVMIESMACGTPVAAYPVTGPVDVIEPGSTGSMNNNLAKSVETALTIPRETVVESSSHWTWSKCASQFINYLHFKV